MIHVQVIQIGADVLERFPMLGNVTSLFQISRNIMEGARAKLIKTAQEQLSSTAIDYINGIQPLEREGKSVSLSLVGVLPNMIENGWDARFLHDTLLSDDTSGWKVNAEGLRYRVIPFRHKTPGAGPQGGQPMGSQFTPSQAPSLSAPHTIVEDSRKLGNKIYRQAQKLITKKEARMGATGPTGLRKGLAPLLRPHHVTDIFSSMIVNKQPVTGKGGGVGFQRTYSTFRTISESEPGAWYHPGIEARDFMSTLPDYIAEVAPGAVEAFINEVMK